MLPNHMTWTTTAYLFLIHKLNEKGIPVFYDIRILSDGRPTAHSGQIYSLVFELSSKDGFAAAQEAIMAYLKDYQHLRWAYVLLQKRKENIPLVEKGCCVACSKNLGEEPAKSAEIHYHFHFPPIS